MLEDSQRVEYIFELCDKALQVVCTSINHVSDNIVSAALPMVKKRKSSIGLFGYALSHSKPPSRDSNAEAFLSFLHDVEYKSKIDAYNVEDIRKMSRGSILAGALLEQELYAKRIHFIRAGRCTELCILILNFLRRVQVDIDITVELFRGLNFDHTFLVIERDIERDSSDPQSFTDWKKKTIILDPWLRCRFTLDKMPDFWRDMACLNNWGNIASWQNYREISAPKVLTDENHPFFSMLKLKLLDTLILSPPELIAEDSPSNEEKLNPPIHPLFGA